MWATCLTHSRCWTSIAQPLCLLDLVYLSLRVGDLPVVMAVGREGSCCDFTLVASLLNVD